MISLTFLVGSVGRTFSGQGFLIYVHLSYNFYEIGFCSKGLLIVYWFRISSMLGCSVLLMKCLISVSTM